MQTFKKLIYLCLVVCLLLQLGCARAPLQRYAKNGDILTIPFASIKRGTNGEYIRPSDLNVTITPEGSGVPITIPVLDTRRVFSPGGDWFQSHGAFIPRYDGQWVAVVGLMGMSGGEPLPLPPGKATIAITSEKLVEINLDIEYYSASLDALPIEILPGEAVQDKEWEDVIQSIGVLSWPHQFEIRPNTLAGVNSIAGMELVLKFNHAVVGESQLSQLFPDPNVQLITHFTKDESDIVTVKAVVLNPHGFHRDLDGESLVGGSADGRISQSDLSNIALILQVSDMDDQLPVDSWQESIAIDEANSYYFDMNGDRIVDLLPELTLVKHRVDSPILQ